MTRDTKSDSGEEPRTWARRDRAIVSANQVFARTMRKQPTEAERELWWHLRHRLPVSETHFRRQVRIGRYIVDFASHGAKLAIEIDGSQHAEQAAADAERTRFIEAQGYRVVRFWNNEVLTNIDGVLAAIQSALATTPTPDPSPQGGGERRRSA
jgi:very-short-patch-repair endonuclease